MGETAVRASQAPAAAHLPGGPAVTTASAAPRETGRTTDAVRVIVRQPAHRVRGRLTAGPR
ncbi:hypothetical protein GCM10009838_69860 [Catenulispora subtropica]|uniref:Uncharacterized protein n=1 Tax=Catenulispora subtropica TaxID=450798 RepID=A0ABP5EDJ7_9ACTN